MTAGSSIFENERLLGQGGMGFVHAAIDRRTGREVAVKRIHRHLLWRPTILERFEREARAHSRIRSPFVVSVIDVGRDPEGPYLAMELLEGESLAKRLDREQRLTVEDTLRIGDELLAGAEAAHRAGVIHRDLGIANVFLARTAEGEHVKILDFGISKLEGQRGTLTGTGEIFGTLDHLAPERFEKHPATNRSDLWSIGVVLYRCLGGTPPFGGANEFQLMGRIMRDHPDPLPSLVDERVRDAFAPFFARAFEKKPAQRFASADEMRGALADVRAVLTGTRRVPPRVAHAAHVAPASSAAQGPQRRFPIALAIALIACAAAGAWAGTSSLPNEPPPGLTAFAVEADPSATITLDGSLVVDRSRIPLPADRADRGHVLRVSAPGHVAREVPLPARPGTRVLVRLAKAEAPPSPRLPAAAPPPPAETASSEVATQEPLPRPAKPVSRPHLPPPPPPPAPPTPAASPSSSSPRNALKPITRPPY